MSMKLARVAVVHKGHNGDYELNRAEFNIDESYDNGDWGKQIKRELVRFINDAENIFYEGDVITIEELLT